MNYLKYIELAAENLQFFLWFRSYTKRFHELAENEKVLSPEWHGESEADSSVRPNQVNPEAAAIFKGTDFASESRATEIEKSNPFFTPPHTPNSDLKREAGESIDSYQISMTSGTRADHAQRATNAFESADLKWKPRESSQNFCSFSPLVLNPIDSLCSAVSRRNQPHHFNLHRRRRQPRAQPLL